MKPTIWEGMEQTLREQGVLSAPVDVTQAYTMDFLRRSTRHERPPGNHLQDSRWSLSLFAAVILAGGGAFAYFADVRIILDNVATELRVVLVREAGRARGVDKHLRLDVVAKARSTRSWYRCAGSCSLRRPVRWRPRRPTSARRQNLRARIGDGQPYFVGWSLIPGGPGDRRQRWPRGRQVP